MTITTEDFGDYVLNKPSAHETLANISDYIEAHVAEWEQQEVIWDFSALDMQVLTSADVSVLVSRLQRVRQYRKGKRTALVCSDDLGFGMLRMLHMLLEDQIDVRLLVSKTVDEAVKQLSGQKNTTSDALDDGLTEP